MTIPEKIQHRTAPGEQTRGRTRRWSRATGGAVVVVALSVGLAACQSSSPSAPTVNAGKLFSQALKAQGKGEVATARADYTKVLAQDPNNHYKNNKFVYFNLGVLDQSAGNSTAAASQYRKALLVDPTYLSALYNLAIVETPTSPQSAILLYQQILAVTPKDPNTLYNLGLLLYQTGQVAEGQSMLQEAIFLAPTLRAKLPPSVTL